MTKALENVSLEEAAAARKLVSLILARGWTVSLYDGEEWTLKASNNRRAILSALGTTWADELLLRDADGAKVGGLFLVWGNSAPELVADYYDNEAINSLWNEWHALVDA
jgi:hypothetical protein